MEPRQRLQQLVGGTLAAAAAVPLDHEPLARDAAEATERLQAAVESRDAGGAETAGELVKSAIRAVEALHFGLLKVGVLEADPQEVGAAELVEEVRRLAAEAERAG